MRYIELTEGTKIFPIPATPENVAKAKDFVWKKWQERAAERGYKVSDLSSSCKFSSLFAQGVFGGKIQGNYDHQYVVLNGQVIDLNSDAGDVRSLTDPYKHDSSFWGNPDHKESLASCRPRVRAWLAEFAKFIESQPGDLTEGFSKAVKWKWTDHSAIEHVAEFSIGDIEYTVSFFLKDSTQDLWDFTFTSNNSYRATGTGNAWTVFGTVIAIARRFISKKRPAMVLIESDVTERNRFKVNKRLAAAIVDGMRYDVDVDEKMKEIILRKRN